MAVRRRLPTPEAEIALEELTILTNETTRGVLAFALYRSVAEREGAVRELKERLSLPVHEFALSARRKNPYAYLRELPKDPRAAVFFYDVEDAFPEALGYLNLLRETLLDFPHAVIFWVREYGLREIMTRAPDFYRWGSGVFDFRGPDMTAPLSAIQIAVAEPFSYENRGDLERRLSLYRSLLQDYSQQENPDKAMLAELEWKIGLALYHLGKWSEAREHWLRAYALSQELGDHAGIARSLHNLGALAQDQGDYAAARSLYEQSLAMKQELGDHAGVARSLHNLGVLAQLQGDYATAHDYYEQSLTIAQELGNRIGAASSLHQLGVLAQAQSDYASARTFYEQSQAMFQELGDRAGVAGSLHHLGWLAQLQGDYASARTFYEQSRAIKRELGDRAGLATSVGQLGRLAYLEKDYVTAVRRWAVALETFEELRSPNADIVKGWFADLREELGEKAFNAVLAEAQKDPSKEDS